MAEDDKTKQAEDIAAKKLAAEKLAAAEKAAADKLAAEQAVTDAAAAGKRFKGLLIISGPEAGRRRAGRVFGREPIEVDAASLTKEQFEAIQADPLLSVKRK